ncbi:MAG: hypothetical protein KFF72_08190 [Arthrospira sp. SH-MAG29]|nr:hypothetical protein [Arthrospira sp. SH-MAG29]MBS0016327.1 hypothetical protein [Arthrospira sp. SH-MAG29]
MYAIKSSPPPQKPQQSPRPLRRRSQARVRPRTHRHHRAIALETTAKILTNFTLSAFALVALVQIVPNQRMVHEKWREIEAEVNITEARVQQHQEEFSRYFDPQQAQNIMQENGNRVDPRQRQIVWLHPNHRTADKPELSESHYAELDH